MLKHALRQWGTPDAQEAFHCLVDAKVSQSCLTTPTRRGAWIIIPRTSIDHKGVGFDDDDASLHSSSGEADAEPKPAIDLRPVRHQRGFDDKKLARSSLNASTEADRRHAEMAWIRETEVTKFSMEVQQGLTRDGKAGKHGPRPCMNLNEQRQALKLVDEFMASANQRGQRNAYNPLWWLNLN